MLFDFLTMNKSDCESVETAQISASGDTNSPAANFKWLQLNMRLSQGELWLDSIDA
jgi:hypothetical protein